MTISKRFFPEVMPDNELAYFAHLEGIICSVDEHSSMMITKHSDSYHFRIATSLPKYNNMLIKQLINFHNIFDIKLIFSKKWGISYVILSGVVSLDKLV